MTYILLYLAIVTNISGTTASIHIPIRDWRPLGEFAGPNSCERAIKQLNLVGAVCVPKY